jgi:tetratricopeptide (TPR) repeat protein
LSDYNAALKDFEKALDKNPEYYHAYVNRGICYSEMRKTELAMKDFNVAIQLSPLNG